MSRESTLLSLVRLDRPLAELTADLASFTWDADPAVVLTRRDIVAVLERFAAGKIDAAAVERWADLIECREDIRFESGHEKTIAGAIFDLANPALNGPLQTLLPTILLSLG